MKIDLQTLVEIGKSAPSLTVADYAVALSKTTKDMKRESDRERISAKRKKSDMERHDATQSDKQPDRSDMERQLYADADRICGNRSGGLIAKLLKQNNQQIEPVRAMLDLAATKHNPRAFLNGAVKHNGSGSDVVDAFDDLIRRTGSEALGDSDTLRDVTPRGGHPG